MKTSGRLCGLIFLFISGFVWAQDFTGTYVSKSGGVTYTLVLRQDAQRRISGTLSGSNGKYCQVSATIEEDIAVGLCEGDINAQFEAEFEGSRLLWTMFELGADDSPDFTRDTNLDFARQSTKAPAGQTDRQSLTAVPKKFLIKWNQGESYISMASSSPMSGHRSAGRSYCRWLFRSALRDKKVLMFSF
jgi:hypothetical protein